MSEYNFNYLKDFKCLADKCNRTCCAGWEILIDKKTLKIEKLLTYFQIWCIIVLENQFRAEREFI